MFLSLVLGGLIGAAVNWFFAHQSSREFKKEADALRSETVKVRNLVNLLARVLDDQGVIKGEFNEAGELMRIVQMAGSAKLAAMTMHGTGTVGSPSDDSPP